MFKSRFPYFSVNADDKNKNTRVYLDSAATTQKLDSVLLAMDNYHQEYNASVHRGAYQSAQLATKAYEQARVKIQQLISAKKADEVIFTSGATESINMIANGLSINDLSGTTILVMASEHHANLLPWQAFAKRHKLNMDVIELSSDGIFSERELSRLYEQLSDDIALIAIAHVSNALGNIYPLEDIIEKAAKHNIVSVVDGTQALAHISVDVQKLNCDFYVFSGHKMYGPCGIGVLYGKYEALTALAPSKLGGEMVVDVDFSAVSFQMPPLKFEGGTPNIAGAIGLGEAAEFVKNNIEEIKRHEEKLHQYLIRQLSQFDSLIMVGNSAALPTKNNINNHDFSEHLSIGTLSFTVKNQQLNDLALYLSQAGVAVRVGHHCAMPLMKRLKLQGTLRVSLACYSDLKDIDYLIEHISHFLRLDESQARLHALTETKSVDENKQHFLLASKVQQSRGWDNVYRQLLLASKSLRILPQELRTSLTSVSGCETDLWLAMADDRFAAYSQSKVVRGILALLIERADHNISCGIHDFDYLQYLEFLGLSHYFSEGRRDGIANAIKTIDVIMKTNANANANAKTNED
ncbi:aminotransferase class V-fold PLP-dependent enzyme [Glaciecola sp. MH2013]|uniref:aminotransferase class V-fold PLP-dependent enzyme n=1 Tax=Glaciecola sp. MH2013 TaxID=2785524 RepID=UPI00189F60EA|nr:aminotransferase class V-fold PLP-dependent enzyme [Glaciecola sp. MH2013]MBF7072957.1 aminotransferase class V-fold PLP-dependent enzyme [Glaciecola sp. MH2013]